MLLAMNTAGADPAARGGYFLPMADVPNANISFIS